MLEVSHLSVRYGDYIALDDLSFSVREGEWLMIVGPNGSGKSTTLSAVSQSIPYRGKVLFRDRDIRTLPDTERARSVGVLTQNHYVGYSFTVEEVVRLGRYSHRTGLFGKKDRSDLDAVENALRLTGMTEQREQSVLTLSGGELQRTFLAQLMAQDPQVLLLDEPTNHLDLIYQKQIFALIREWLQTPGRAVISVVHDLSLARLYGTRALLMDHGCAVAEGAVDEVLSPEKLNRVYGMDVADWMRQLLSQWE